MHSIETQKRQMPFLAGAFFILPVGVCVWAIIASSCAAHAPKPVAAPTVAPAPPPPPLVKKYDSTALPTTMRVSVANLDGICHERPGADCTAHCDQVCLNFGASCFTDPPGWVSVVGVEGDTVLVRYNGKPGTFVNETVCPDKTLFLTTVGEFARWRKEIDAAKQADIDRRALIKRLLEQF